MSHHPQRKEKNCLNCGTLVQGRYCHVCGQENTVTHQSFWSLVKHFVYDVLHFDGKFFHTVGYLFTRPGFVARQFAEGKRMRYLDPIRMYLFTSAVFFLLFFSFSAPRVDEKQGLTKFTTEDRLDLADDYQKALDRNPSDSALQRKIVMLRDTARPIVEDSVMERPKSFTFSERDYRSVQEYDSVQAVLPAKEKDSWLSQQFVRQSIKIHEKYGYNNRAVNIFVDIFLHKLPYLLFLSLPFFALILKLLYRRQRQFFYSDHAVFTLYHYIFSFILLLFIFGVRALAKWSGWGVFNFLQVALILLWPVYLFIELKNFYRQGKGKTFGKFLLLNLSGLFVVILLFVFFLVFSIFQM